jgi:hypothetical protein
MNAERTARLNELVDLHGANWIKHEVDARGRVAGLPVGEVLGYAHVMRLTTTRVYYGEGNAGYVFLYSGKPRVFPDPIIVTES